jgi:VanZ family protein
MKRPLFIDRASFWAGLFFLWFATLWFLSGRPAAGPQIDLGIPIDKVLHFGYFFGGAGLLSASFFLRPKGSPAWDRLHLLVILILFFVGSLDEWHQSWYPYRSGNDAGDLTADLLGALAGTLIFRKLQPRVFPVTS